MISVLNKRLWLIATLALLISSVGCAGGRGHVKTEQTNVPISFTSAIPDSKGRPLMLGAELTAVGSFYHAATSYGFFYSATPMNLDISEAATMQVSSAGGEGIVNLSIDAAGCPLNFIVPFQFLPMWPGCVTIHFQGLIVRRKR